MDREPSSAYAEIRPTEPPFCTRCSDPECDTDCHACGYDYDPRCDGCRVAMRDAGIAP